MKSDSEPWAPYVPTPEEPWNLEKVAHLHRRAGFAANWKELHRDLKAGPAESIDRLLHPPPAPQKFRRVADVLKNIIESSGDDFMTTEDLSPLQAWWLFRLTFGSDPLGEKLTLFWHNHFATAISGVFNLKLMLDQNELFRNHARGQFGDLLIAIEANPAMLKWLNGGANQKEHPNENFARELLELFTLGEGHYSETDIREAARGLTGWKPGRDTELHETNEFLYDETLVDTSPKTFLGQTGAWRRNDIFRIILQQPEAAKYLCRRLYRWFVSESTIPDDTLIEPLAIQMRASNYSIEHVVGIILRSQHFFSPAARWQRVKSPVEFCVGTIRQLEPKRISNLLPLVALNCDQQGQILFNPPSVKGWEGGTAWLNSNSTLTRLNWIAELLNGNPLSGLPAYDPTRWLKQHSIEPSQAVNSFSKLLLQNNLSPESEALANRLAGKDPSQLRSALLVLLQTPEFQLA
tara:strand:- start:1430 stop:2821 length:1392 start_codon:yes stop_codon:yes gene_type:complete